MSTFQRSSGLERRVASRLARREPDPCRRSRARRLSDAVVAGYIHDISPHRHPAPPARRQRADDSHAGGVLVRLPESTSRATLDPAA